MWHAAITEFNLEKEQAQDASKNGSSKHKPSPHDVDASEPVAIPHSFVTGAMKHQAEFVPRDLFPAKFGKQKKQLESSVSKEDSRHNRDSPAKRRHG